MVEVAAEIQGDPGEMLRGVVGAEDVDGGPWSARARIADSSGSRDRMRRRKSSGSAEMRSF